MRKILLDQDASAVPLILFVITIFACGGLYSLFFLEVAFPSFNSWIPDGDIKVVVLMCMYAIPLFVIVVGMLSLLLAGLKREVLY